jgi:hypothetical protein
MTERNKKQQKEIPYFLQARATREKDDDLVGTGRPLLSSRRGVKGSEFDHQRTFTTQELEDLIWKSSQTIVEVQKQIQRGEETYYEETQTHGSSVFKGFETFIDARDVGTSSGGPTSLSARRMPGDYRWFSSSCSNIARHMKQRTFVPQAPPPAPTPPPTRAANATADAITGAVISSGARTAELLSGQKRPLEETSGEKASDAPPAKERRVEETPSSPSAEETKASKAKEEKNTRSAPKTEAKRRTTRKRKSNS